MSDVEQGRARTPWGLLAFLAALLAFDFFMPLVYPLADPLPEVTEAAYFGFLLAQVGLHAALVVLWQDWLAARMASILFLAVLAVLHLSQGLQTLEYSTPIFVIQWVLVAVAMLSLSVMKWELRRWTPQQLQTVKPRCTQISVLGLIILVTVACIVVAISTQVDWGVGVSIAFLVPALFAVQTVVLVAGVLMPRQMRWMTILSLVIALAMAGLWQLICTVQGFALHWPMILFSFMMPALLQVAFLLVMRWLGYRLWRVAAPIGQEVRMRLAAEVLAAATPIPPTPALRPRDGEKRAFPLDPKP